MTEHGAPVTRAGSLATRLGIEETSYKPHWKSRRPDIVLGQSSFLNVLVEIVSALRSSASVDVLNQLRDERIAEKAAILRNIDPAILETLEELRRSNLKLGVISNAFPEDVASWGDSPLQPFFDVVVFSCDVRLAKPDHRIYLLACQRLDVAPHHALFVGDGTQEVAGARAAGLMARRAGWFAKEHRQEPDQDDALWRPRDVVGAAFAA